VSDLVVVETQRPFGIFVLFGQGDVANRANDPADALPAGSAARTARMIMINVQTAAVRVRGGRTQGTYSALCFQPRVVLVGGHLVQIPEIV